jgi:hypothetical protein
MCAPNPRSAYNAADEITAAFSVAFSPDGAHLVAGYDKVRCCGVFACASQR